MKKLKDILEHLSSVDPAVWKRVAFVLVNIINLILDGAGVSRIVFTDEKFYVCYLVVSCILALISIFLLGYKNNSVTGDAQLADKFLHNYMDAKDGLPDVKEDLEFRIAVDTIRELLPDELENGKFAKPVLTALDKIAEWQEKNPEAFDRIGDNIKDVIHKAQAHR